MWLSKKDKKIGSPFWYFFESVLTSFVVPGLAVGLFQGIWV
jgi:hypothetical protein